MAFTLLEHFTKALDARQSVSTKKAYLTRQKNQLQAHYDSVELELFSARANNNQGSFLGEKECKMQLKSVRENIRIINDLYSKL